MFKELIDKLKRKLFIKIKSVDSDKYFEEISDLLELSFENAMKQSCFKFNIFNNFEEKLKQVQELGGKIFVLKYFGKIVGTVSVKPRILNTWYHQGQAVNLCHFAVLPEYQKHGFGKMLVDTVNDYAQQLGLPVFLTTPEKNYNAIKFYEKLGFHKVKMYLAGDHYSVYLFKPDNSENFRPERCVKLYEKSALLCLMKNYKICNIQSNKRVQKRWNKEFYPYLQCENAEICEDMYSVYRKYAVTPKVYIKSDFKNKTDEERKKLAKGIFQRKSKSI